MCNYNRYFADNYGDICFLKKERPKGYEFIEKYKKFSSCEYCCKTRGEDYMCNTCFNENYKYYVGEPNNGRCVQKCPAGYPFINYDKGTCTSSCNDANCNALNND